LGIAKTPNCGHISSGAVEALAALRGRNDLAVLSSDIKVMASLHASVDDCAIGEMIA
jgi:hypothetical protein